jgi:hypothetical protein
LASLRSDVGGEPFRGTLAIYGFDENTYLPGLETTRWLVREAERLLAHVYSLRAALANAYIISRLAKTALVNPAFRLLRRALSAVLPNDACSIYTREAGSRNLVRIDSAGLESGRNKEADCFTIRDAEPQESITAHCAVHPSRAWRINFGDADPIYQSANPPPKAHQESFEPLEILDAQHHRRFGIGVRGARESGEHAIGVIRMFRSGQSVPFTHMDGRLVERVAATYHCCQFLFANWRFTGREQEVGPFVVSPTPALLVAVLTRAVDRFRARGRDVRQGAVFEYCPDAVPAYRRFAYYSPKHQLPPDERLAPLAEDLPGQAAWGRRTITVTPTTWSDGQHGERVCIPIMTWSGPHLVQSVCCLDLDGRHEWRVGDHEDVLRLGIEAAAMLAKNRWRDPPLAAAADAPPLTSAYLRYVATQVTGVTNPTLLPAHQEEPEAVSGWPLVPEGSLGISGVRVRPDGTECAIPLWLGPFRVALLRCGLSDDLAGAIRKAIRKPSQIAYLPLHTCVGLVTGAWCRIVAPKTDLWKAAFTLDPSSDSEGMRTWREKVTGPTASELANGRLETATRTEHHTSAGGSPPQESGSEE